jgi:tRNA A37 threonylcarbamoyladenosine synthetase subunit TsaC/SUA5/YrdC
MNHFLRSNTQPPPPSPPPPLIHDHHYHHHHHSYTQSQVDFIVEAGYRGSKGEGLSTVVDLTQGELVVLRQGLGVLPVS